MCNLSTDKNTPRARKILFFIGAGSAAVLWSVSPASAIRCNGPFQPVRGEGEIVTPYCEDNYLAAIARSYGWKVSNRAVRDNPELRARICRHIGHDARLIRICSSRNDSADGGNDSHGDD